MFDLIDFNEDHWVVETSKLELTMSIEYEQTDWAAAKQIAAQHFRAALAVLENPHASHSEDLSALALIEDGLELAITYSDPGVLVEHVSQSHLQVSRKPH